MSLASSLVRPNAPFATLPRQTMQTFREASGFHRTRHVGCGHSLSSPSNRIPRVYLAQRPDEALGPIVTLQWRVAHFMETYAVKLFLALVICTNVSVRRAH